MSSSEPSVTHSVAAVARDSPALAAVYGVLVCIGILTVGLAAVVALRAGVWTAVFAGAYADLLGAPVTPLQVLVAQFALGGITGLAVCAVTFRALVSD